MIRLWMIWLVPLAYILAGCATPNTIVKEVVREVKVPVHMPCVRDRPSEVQALREKLARDGWDSLTTDQREKLLLAQAQDRKAFGDKLVVATAGCSAS